MIPVAIHYPEDLPVSQRREEIAKLVSEHQVVIVAGETGSGKTTQLPKILLELGCTSIGHTQPRRIAARTIAERIAEELGQEVGELVGYQVRFTDRVGKNTRIKLMTDGILLNEINRDRELQKYDAIIIDEAHERSLTVDFLIGYLKQLLPRRPDLKVVITSATIDPESFARHFAAADGTPAPIIEVTGRTYPVEIRYRPLVAEAPAVELVETSARNTAGGISTGSISEIEEAAEDRDPIDGINAAIDELGREGSGDVLVFLSGEAEIRDAEEAIRGRISTGSINVNTEVLPLYGRLSAADQHRVFRPSSTAGTRRRIVLATNVAETSLTVPGIKYVIDAGTARISRYSVRSKVQRLPIEAISQASANQRSGRSGRTSNGIAIRLYSEEDFMRRPEYTEPEILRTNLAAVILQMISLGLGDIQNFPFLQPPDSRGIKDGLDLLRELGAVEDRRSSDTRGSSHARGSSSSRPQKGLLAGEVSTSSTTGGTSSTTGSTSPTTGGGPKITAIGKQLAQLPIDPRLARMVIESKTQGTTREVMAIVAGLSIQDPRERPLEKRPQADQAHARFIDKTSDFLTLLNLWNYLKEKERELSGNQFRRLCKTEYLNFLRVREWADVYRQLERMAKPLGLVVGDAVANPNGIHRSLLAGLLSQIGIKDVAKDKAKSKQGDYIGARQVRFTIFPGSALAKKQPAEIMSAELVETSRLFARMNAAIDLAWAEPLAGELVKRSYGEPHWEKKQGAAVAYEKVTLYGVPIVARRRIQFSRVDPAYARELFIRHALVQGEWDLDRLDHRISAFDAANRSLRKELAELEERTRRRDILYDDEAVFEFYHRRIPADVVSQRSFESWWKKARVDTPELLTMTRENLVEDEPEPVVELVETSYPKTWRQGDQNLGLSYRFEPGSDDDGVTVQVPLALLARLSSTGFDWQVPGLREELVTALIKSLPKAIRRTVVPAADWARKLIAELPPEPEGELTAVLAELIHSKTYVPISTSDFDLERIPAHLKVTFSVLDERGRQLASGKELGTLQDRLKASVRESVARASVAVHSELERAGLTTWDFDELPKKLDTKQGGNTIRAYPALVDEVSGVAIRLMSTPQDQAKAMRAGVRRLLLLAVPSPTGYVQSHLTGPEKLALAQSPYRTTAELFADCLAACVDAVLANREVWTRAQFEAVRDEVSASIVDSLFGAVSVLAATLGAARAAEKAIGSASNIALLSPLADMREQLSDLVYAGFVSATGLDRLSRLPIYLRGITHRVGKLSENLGRDRVWMTEVQSATERYRSAGGELPLPADAPEHIRHARWLLEELRISLFAQHLGTAEPASLQRIVKILSQP